MKTSKTKLSRLQAEQEFFDNSLSDSDQYMFSYYSDSFLTILEEEAYKYFPNLKRKKLLFYGCGVNWAKAYYFYKSGAYVSAIDISSRSIELMQHKTTLEGAQDRIEFIQMDCTNLDYPDETFDVIYGRAILHHLDLTEANQELLRVLKKDGVAVFIEPLGMNPIINLYRRLTPNMRTVDEKPLNYDDINNLANGFSSVTYKEMTLLGLPIIISQSLLRRGDPPKENLLRSYELDEKLFRAFPRLRRFCWNVILAFKK